jgi:hypothetical protein
MGGAGRIPSAKHGHVQQFVICDDCGGSGRVKLDSKDFRQRTKPCPMGCGPTPERPNEKRGEVNGTTCFRCRGEGTVIIIDEKVNPAFIRSTFMEPCDPVSERIDRLVCELRQRPKTLGYYFVVWMEFCDARGGTQDHKAQRLHLTYSSFKKRLERALDWVGLAIDDRRPANLIPFPYRQEPETNVISLPCRLQKITA